MDVLHRIVTCAVGLLGLAGCAGTPVKAPHTMHPIPEDRARELIARTFRDAGVAPETDRFVHVGRGEKNVRLEVAAAGHKFGVAYLTSDDWAKLGDALPPRQTSGSLVVAMGEGGTHILCIFADDYTEAPRLRARRVVEGDPGGAPGRARVGAG